MQAESSQSQPFHSASAQQSHVPGVFNDSTFVDLEEAPEFPDQDESRYTGHGHDRRPEHDHEHEHEDGDHIDDTLLDVPKGFELNINVIFSNAYRQKINSHLDTVEHSAALDLE
jgi:hypothetical protein